MHCNQYSQNSPEGQEISGVRVQRGKLKLQKHLKEQELSGKKLTTITLEKIKGHIFSFYKSEAGESFVCNI